MEFFPAPGLYPDPVPPHRAPGGSTKFFPLSDAGPRLSAMFRHPHRVSYAECTVGNHIYHSRYLDLLEAARGEFLRSLGCTVRELQDADYIFPLIEARLHYKFPARYDDLLAIEVWPTLAERVRLNFGHRILNQDGKLILVAETLHCCTTRAEKPRRLPPELIDQIRQRIQPPPG
jgi:acyl-CoA thioester hydrolase